MKEITLPRSKSLVIRYMILEFLYSDHIMDYRDDDAEDVKTVYNALQTIQKSGGSKTAPILVDIKDCGAAFRFLMATLSITEGNWMLTGTERLLQRPIEPLVFALRRIGASIEYTEQGWHIIGELGITATSMVIDCTVSSQFATALWLISQKIGSPAIHTTPTHFSSESYLEITKQVWGNYFLDGVPNRIEADWSAAAYWYAYILLNPGTSIIMKGLEYPSIQQDSIIATWFSEWGVETIQTEQGIQISNRGIQEIPNQKIDLSNHLDLAPVLCSLATLYPFQLTITGISNLKYKESERGNYLVEILSQFTSIEHQLEEAEKGENNITIFRREKPLPHFIPFDSNYDHRMVMAFQLFASKAQIEIKNKDAITKSYPHFFINHLNI